MFQLEVECFGPNINTFCFSLDSVFTKKGLGFFEFLFFWLIFPWFKKYSCYRIIYPMLKKTKQSQKSQSIFFVPRFINLIACSLIRFLLILHWFILPTLIINLECYGKKDISYSANNNQTINQEWTFLSFFGHFVKTKKFFVAGKFFQSSYKLAEGNKKIYNLIKF